MRDYLDFYIGGEWVSPAEPRTLDVVNPADESVAGRISLGASADVDRAVAAAKAAFPAYSETSREERLDLLRSIAAEYQKRYAEIAEAITEEMGAPPLCWLSGPRPRPASATSRRRSGSSRTMSSRTSAAPR